ncbi:MAG: TrkA C-terminal domain-containing protein [Candidatus Bathyarchaeia archaeon]
MGRIGRIEYKPFPVLHVLKEMKSLSQLAIDLGYLAVLFNEKDLATELLRLEDRIDEDTYQLWMSAALATRDAEDAERIVGIIKVGSSIDEISDAAADLARIVYLGLSTHPSLSRVFSRLEDRFSKVRVHASSKLVGQTIGQASLDTKIGLEIIAIKRETWIIRPDDEEVLRAGDTLLTKGPSSRVEALKKFVRPSVRRVRAIRGFERVEELLADIINTTDLMVDLAYTSLIYNNVEVAKEVISLEEQIDHWHYRLEIEAARLLRRGRERGILGLIRMGLICEMISDAAASIADMVARGLESHEILTRALEEAEDTVLMREVEHGSPMDGKTISETRLDERFNIKVLAVRKGPKWIYEPDDSMRVVGGDTVIATGIREGIDEVKRLCSREWAAQNQSGS